MGPFLSDENDKTPAVPISLPWLQRRANGFWFQLIDEPEVKSSPVDSDYESVSTYQGRTITEEDRQKCKYRV